MDGPASTTSEERLRRGAVVLGKYEVEGVLGEGGTGVVYSARDTASGESVALKVMHPHLASEVQIRGRFMREGAILRRLEGPHVCRILEVGEVENPAGGVPLLCLALPRIDGRPLDRLIADGKLPEARAVAIAKQVLEALECAHGQGVIHRDLKPHNVLVDAAERATVVDFGLSKIVNGRSGTGTTNLTTLNMVFGTPEYMSPEQAQGDELDGRCDLYACGVMLYEMLTGALPFGGETPLAVLTAHLTEPPPSPAAKVPGLSPAVTAIVLRALSKDPNNRYSSAGAMRASLERAEIFPDEPDDVPERAALPPETPPAPAPEEPVPETKRTGPTPSSAGPFAAEASTTEPSLSPRPPNSRRTGDADRERPSRSRVSQTVSKRPVTPPRRALGWTLAWIIVVGGSVVVGVALGLR